MNRHFRFSRKERAGILAIATTILVFLLISRFTQQGGNPVVEFADSSELTWVNLAGNSVPETDNRSFSANLYDIEQPYFEFDPNLIDQAGFEQLGFTPKQSASIIDYRTRYGPFKDAAGFGKLYVVSDEKFSELLPYIRIGSTVSMVELNSATSDEMEKLNGIGPTLAQRILKYKKKLGGFFTPEQLREVYGLSEDVADKIIPECCADTSLILRINVNSSSKEILESHPYFTFPVVAAVLKERNIRKLTNSEFLSSACNEETRKKIDHYISFE